MTTLIVVYQVCNGCGRNTFEHSIEIADSLAVPDQPTFELCAECARDGKFICTDCQHIHDAAHPCTAQLLAVMKD